MFTLSSVETSYVYLGCSRSWLTRVLPSSWLDVEVGSQMPGTKFYHLHFRTPRIGLLNMTNYRSVILIRRPDRSALIVLVMRGAPDSPLEVVICKRFSTRVLAKFWVMHSAKRINNSVVTTLSSLEIMLTVVCHVSSSNGRGRRSLMVSDWRRHRGSDRWGSMVVSCGGGLGRGGGVCDSVRRPERRRCHVGHVLRVRDVVWRL